MTSNTLSCFLVSLMNLSFSGHMSGHVPTNTLDMSRSVLLGWPAQTNKVIWRICITGSRGRDGLQLGVKGPNLGVGPCPSVPGGGTCPRPSRPAGPRGGGGRRGRWPRSRGPPSCSPWGARSQTGETWPTRTSSQESWQTHRQADVEDGRGRARALSSISPLVGAVDDTKESRILRDFPSLIFTDLY